VAKENGKLKSIVLLSGGLDSTVNLYHALKKTDVVLALTFDYGQRAAHKEILTAKRLCEKNSVRHTVLRLPWIKNLGQSGLTNSKLAIPKGKSVQIANKKQSESTAKSVWVPNRNGIFLNVAAGFAESLGANYVVPGFNLEEASTFPDNSQGFLKALDQSFYFSTANHVRAICYTTHLNKTQIVKMGLKLKVPLHQIWPCYFAGKKWCGQCESCLRSERALAKNGLDFLSLSKSEVKKSKVE